MAAAFLTGAEQIYSARRLRITTNADSSGAEGVGGVFNVAGATFNLQNTILAGNFRALGGLAVDSDYSGTITSHGFNLMGVTTLCAINGAAPTLAGPLLGPLQNNGGPTQTHALLAGSPAIDGGDPNGCRDHLGALILTDQRGFRRTMDGIRDGTALCDIGAVEFGSGAGVTFKMWTLTGMAETTSECTGMGCGLSFDPLTVASHQ